MQNTKFRIKKYRHWLLLLIAFVLPHFLANSFTTHLFIRALTYGIVIIGFTIFVGYTGQVSLGHAAFFGMGAYVSAILAINGVPFLITLLIAGVLVSLLGLLVGLLVLRTEGHYLALASIAVSMILLVLVKNASFTGGPSGLIGIPKPELFGYVLLSNTSFYYLCLVILITTFILIQRIVNSRIGDALRAIANNELAAESLGIPTFFYKVLSFSISAFCAGIAGSLFAYYDGYISPDVLGMNYSILFLIMAFVGGLNHMYGPVIGAFLLTFLEEYTRSFGDYHVLIYGFLLVIIILYLPKGVVDLPNLVRHLWRRTNWKRERRSIAKSN